MAKVFVTGANGFIGAHLIEFLLRRGDQVTGQIRTTSDIRSLAPLFPQYGSRLHLVIGDIREPDSLGSALDGVEYFFHLAAVLSGTSEADFFETNVGGTRNIVDLVKRHRTDAFKRFLFTSSLAAAGPSPDGTPLDETAQRNPVSWYGKSKRDAEDIVNRAGQDGLPVTIARPSGVFGEREQLLADGTFPLVRAGLKPKVGFSSKTVSLICVGDLVPGLAAAAESPNAVGKTYFFSNPEPYGEGEVMTAIADGLGTKIRIPIITPHSALSLAAIGAEFLHKFTRGLPLPTRDKVREVRHRHWACSPEAARRDFGWAAEVTLSDGMKRAARDWLDRRERRNAVHEPFGDRLVKTLSIAACLGVIESVLDLCVGGMRWDGLALILGVTEIPWWGVALLIIAIASVFIGGASFVTIRRGFLLRFVAGAIVGIGLELVNQLWLNLWQWDPNTFGALSAPWAVSFGLGIGAGFGPVITNGIVQALYHKRLRLG
jgi:nucleoside-diphosphate-sugar epimerase